LAISKQHKKELVAQYVDWLNNSQVVILADYTGLTMKDIDGIRKQSREVGGEFHIIKNTLGIIAFDKAGLELPADYLVGATAIGFAFDDAPGMAKVMTKYAKDSDFVKIKGGYLESNLITAEGIKSLADLPPLPVMRAQLLGTILAPASKLARILSEPARQVAAVLNAYGETDTPPAAA